MAWLLTQLRHSSARLASSRLALPGLETASETSGWASPLDALAGGRAAYLACSQQLRCASGGSEATKSPDSEDTGAAGDEPVSSRAKWRQWAEQRLGQRQPDAPPPPPEPGMSPDALEAAEESDESEPAAQSDESEPAARQPPSDEELSQQSAQDAFAAADEALASSSSQDVADTAAAAETAAKPDQDASMLSLAQRLGLSPRPAADAAADSAVSGPAAAQGRPDIEAQIESDPAAAAAALAAEQQAAQLRAYDSAPPDGERPPADAEAAAAEPVAQPAADAPSVEWQQFLQQQKEAAQPLASAATRDVGDGNAEHSERHFRGSDAGLGPAPNPTTGYSALGTAGARPLPHAPPRLHPTRDFFPGQFYRPADLNPFVPSETSQYAPVSANRQTMPSRAEVLQQADFRNVGFLGRFVTETGRIVPRRRTGLQAKVHRRLARQIKVAKLMALAPIDRRPRSQPYQPRAASASAGHSGFATSAAPRGGAPQPGPGISEDEG